MGTPDHGSASVHGREADFHDRWALSTPLEQIRVREAFEAPTAVENRFILGMMGDVTGRRILDIGAGLGESSVYLALRGANVTIADVSPRMLERAVRLGKLHGVELNAVAAAGEKLGLPENTFDIVYIANTIHHVADKDALFRELRKVLKPRGRFFSIDPLAYNPLINVYRRMATEMRTPDERPLTFADLELVRQYLADVRHREFWIMSLGLFVKYYLVDRIHPNQDRYWKRIYEETWQGLWWWHPLRAMDAVLTRLPLVRRLAWTIVMWGHKPPAGPTGPTGPRH